MTTHCELEAIGEQIWRVGTAAVRLAQLAAETRPRPPRESEFVYEVERDLRARHVTIERERKIEGRSGHEHRVTLFLPKTDAILEPITGHWNQVTATYAKFGDLRGADGFHLYALLDDRQQGPDEDVARLLVQVSDVVQWSRRDDWLSGVA